ncbi:MAG: Na+/H+ antiporter NhaC family protein [Ruminococcaceae bacterium]|nr:Na+/H+ antiporter NhaC family protein [Oscillospiraceae bacterium]
MSKRIFWKLVMVALVCFVICPLLMAVVSADTSAPASSTAPATTTAPEEESGEPEGSHAYDHECPYCLGEGCDDCDGGRVYSDSNFFGTAWSLLPPVIAIVLALITKEVYSSLFVGILTGGLLYANFNIEGAFNSVMSDGFIASLADPGDAGILMFLVILGIIVVLMNKAGGSAAYGAWAKKNIKSRGGAMLSTFGLGCLIFVDDYFNCLTVGGVMLPVTDAHKISRAKLAYIIDATAAPICMIAPISSWAAAVSGVVEGYNGFELFIKAIPYNFYSLLTIAMIIMITLMKFDFGPMKKHEKNAVEKGDLYTTAERPYGEEVAQTEVKGKGKVIDLLFPVIVLIACCVFGMIYNGFTAGGAEDIINAFANCDATFALPWGSLIALVIIIIYYLIRRVISFKEIMGSLPEGFKTMVPAILILTFAWTLCSMTGLLGAKYFVYNLISGGAAALQMMLPAIIFLIAIGLSFATGTSWGTFGILIPIVTAAGFEGELLVIAVSACLAGAVCGDHCSPISDTTIMASTGAKSEHLNHVTTQLPYALLVAGVSFVGYILAGIIKNWLIVLPVMIVLLFAVLFVLKKLSKDKE